MGLAVGRLAQSAAGLGSWKRLASDSQGSWLAVTVDRVALTPSSLTYGLPLSQDSHLQDEAV